MKKAVACAVLTGALIVLGEPHIRQEIADAAVSLLPAQDEQAAAQRSEYTLQMGSTSTEDMVAVTLYYRYGETTYLGAQRVMMDIRREETIAMRTVTLLVEGPDAARERLSGVFPQGTRVLSVSGDGSIAHVTLSADFLGRPDGAPDGWEDIAQWREEAALRRRLGVESIVAALTENGRYQRVQIYVAETDDDVPQRIPMYMLDTDTQDASIVLAPCGRNESILLTPQKVMSLAMEAWKARDWASLYALIVPDEEGEMPTMSEFEATMRAADATLIDYEVTPGNVDVDGTRCTVVLDASIRAAGSEADIARESVPLVRREDNWALGFDTLNALMVRD